MKNKNDLTEEEIEKTLKEIDPDFVWPEYDNSGNVKLTGKDESGRTWVMITSAEKFHKSMQEAAQKLNTKDFLDGQK